MKFFQESHGIDSTQVFGVLVSDREVAARAHSMNTLLRFQDVVLSRLANMLAAYTFKQLRAEWQTFLQSEELKGMVADRIAARLQVEVKK
jgi:hypothetical protein